MSIKIAASVDNFKGFFFQISYLLHDLLLAIYGYDNMPKENFNAHDAYWYFYRVDAFFIIFLIPRIFF